MTASRAVLAALFLLVATSPIAAAEPASFRVVTQHTLDAEGDVTLSAVAPELLIDGGRLRLSASGGAVDVRLVEVRESRGARDVGRLLVEAPAELAVAPGTGFHALLTGASVGTLGATMHVPYARLAHSDGEASPSVPTLAGRQAGYERGGLAGKVWTWTLEGHKIRSAVSGPLSADLAGSFTLFLYDADVTLVHPHGTMELATGTAREPMDGVAGALGRSEWVTRYAFLSWSNAHATLDATPRTAWVRAAAFDLDVDGRLLASEAVSRLESVDASDASHRQRVAVAGRVSGEATPIEKGYVAGTFEGDVAYARIGTRDVDLTTAAAVAATGVGILGLLGAGLFYARFRKAEVFGHGGREQAYMAIRERPGVDVLDVARLLATSWSNAAYHLRVLEREGFVVARRAGRHRLYFPAGTESPEAQRQRIVMRHPLARSLVEEVDRTPQATQKELGERLGLPSSTVSYHLARLVGAGLLAERREWREKRYAVVNGVATGPGVDGSASAAAV